MVLVIGGVAYLFVTQDLPKVNEPTEEKVEKKAIAEVKPEIAEKAVEELAQLQEENLDPATRIVAVISCTTNSSLGQICEYYKTADGKTHKVYRASKPPIFKYQTDQLLAMALCGDDKRGIPPLPVGRNLDKEFMNSLKTPIVIDPDDSPSVVEQKERVIEARKQVDELMREGIGFSQILLEHQKLLSSNKKFRDEMIREIKKINEEGDPESTQRALDTVNASLRAMGISEIDAPKSAQERRMEKRGY
ncbi:MAG: hypothetical protein MJ109_02365 [Kiritimatiellae bacterium]|nr:hypothetical protein [Kiritimatiellia bacterium]